MKASTEFLVIAAAIAVVIGVGLLFYNGGIGKGYTDGYCAALGGTVLNIDSCNVDGRVIEVKR